MNTIVQYSSFRQKQVALILFFILKEVTTEVQFFFLNYTMMNRKKNTDYQLWPLPTMTSGAIQYGVPFIVFAAVAVA
jgi:hypothetical protein